MIEQYENLLDCQNHLRENLDVLTDAFISYYGEDKKQEIEEKFKKALLIAYKEPEANQNFLREISEIYTNNIIKEVLKRIPSNWTQEDLFKNYSLNNSTLLPITYFKKFYDQYKLTEKERQEKYKEEGLKYIQNSVPQFTQEDYEEIIKTGIISQKYANLPSYLKNNILYYSDLSNEKKQYERLFNEAKDILEKIEPNITLENISQVLETGKGKSLIKYAEVLPDVIEEYRIRMQKYSPYKEELEKQAQFKNKLSNEYYLKFIEENIDLLKEYDRQQVEIFKKDPTKHYALTRYTNMIFGYSLGANSILESFSEESEKILNDPEEASWKKNSIREDRIKFFKENGINLGDEYETYLKNSEVKKIYPSTERIEKFIESKNRILNELNNEYYTNLPSYKETRKEIEEHHLLDTNDSFNTSLYTDALGATFISPNIKKTTNGYDLFSLVVICCNSNSSAIDHSIIHELNHLFETTLCKVEQEHYEAISGWDIITGDIQKQISSENTTSNNENRKYELLNEIINELIAQEIYEKMLEKNQYIFDTKQTAKVHNTTSYEHTFFLVKDFFKEFKKEILESRSNGNIEIILNKVGKENFDELNNLFNIFYENFQGFKIYNLLQSLKDKKETDQTKIYWNLIEKRDEILEKMRQHSMQTELNNQSVESERKKL